ncbi:MAG: transcription termination factor Rho [Endomicrobiales bacterium]
MSQTAKGVFQYTRNGAGELRDPQRSFLPGPNDAVVVPALVKQYRLIPGAFVEGPVQGRQLTAVETIGGLSPQEFMDRTPFDALTAIDPRERFDLSRSTDASMRILDLITPIGKGTRGLIVSPAKAGKTTLLMKLAKTIRAADAGARIVVLLVDERPEEVTFFKRGVDAEVIASSSDRSIAEHVALTELVLAHIRIDLECKKDVVVLVDSLTRMARAFNHKGSSTGRTMSGGVDIEALTIPRRFLGLARNIENGGSVTILATTLVDTGSRMDDLIFQEFKGTGNCEIVLSRELAEQRIFPAINIMESGTRKEELLYDKEDVKKIAGLRKLLAPKKPDQMMRWLSEQVSIFSSNKKLLASI